MSNTSNYVGDMGPHGRVNANTEHNNPTPFPAISHPSHLSRSLLLFGYAVTFERIDRLRKDFTSSAGDSEDARKAILQAILDDFVGQFDGCMKVFLGNAKCSVCHESPLVTGSKHATFHNVATDAIWAELKHEYHEIKDHASPLDITADHVFFLKRMFQRLEDSYRHDNVSSLCIPTPDYNDDDDVSAVETESATANSGEAAVEGDCGAGNVVA